MPIPVALNPSNPVFPHTMMASVQSFCEKVLVIVKRRRRAMRDFFKVIRYVCLLKFIIFLVFEI
ncbi:hypothetical protein D3C86_1286740 [compost metagenome]